MYAGRDLSIYTEGTRKALEEALTEAKGNLRSRRKCSKRLGRCSIGKNLNAAIGKP